MDSEINSSIPNVLRKSDLAESADIQNQDGSLSITLFVLDTGHRYLFYWELKLIIKSYQAYSDMEKISSKLLVNFKSLLESVAMHF